VIASSSAAQSSTPSDAENTTVLARRHFERGVEHYSEGNYDAALAELQRSYELSPTYKLLYNLAQVQMERHDFAAALSSLTDYLRLGGTAIAAERVTAVEQDIERLKQRTAELEVDVAIPDAQIIVNAAPVGKSPLRGPIRVNVGSVAVRVEKAGYAPFEQTTSVAGTDRRHVTVRLQPLSAATSASGPSSLQVVTTTNMTPCWISLGAALGLGGATATFGVLSLNAHQNQEELLARYPGRPSELDAARGRLQTFAALTDGFAAATAAAGLVGLYFLFSPPERRETVPADRAKLRLTATPVGVTLRGVF
jgi:hypothetical protein